MPIIQPALPVNVTEEVGCYGDNWSRAMTPLIPVWQIAGWGTTQGTFEDCMNTSRQQGSLYFGVQNLQPNGNVQCWVSDLLPEATKMGTRTNCSADALNRKTGGDMSNFIYKHVGVPTTERSKMVRYLRLQRTSGNDFLNVVQLMAFRNNIPQLPVTGSTIPESINRSWSWRSLIDGSNDTIAHTDGGPNTYIELDLGAEYPIDRVRLVNRSIQFIEPENLLLVKQRLNGITLRVMNGNRQIVFEYPFIGIAAESPLTYNLSIV
jgi:hypothetical protein